LIVQNTYSYHAINKMSLKALVQTLEIRWTSIIKPDLPGYLPAIFAGVMSKSVAPSSVQIAFTKSFLPLPCGPAIKTDLTRGVSSLKTWLPSGSMQYSIINCLMSPDVINLINYYKRCFKKSKFRKYYSGGFWKEFF